MNRTLRYTLATAAISGAALATAGAALGASSGSGASFPATAYTKWCQDSGLCSYSSKGSTGGINDLINGVVDWAATDAPFTAEQQASLAARRGGATLHEEMRYGDLGRHEIQVRTVADALRLLGQLF